MYLKIIKFGSLPLGALLLAFTAVFSPPLPAAALISNANYEYRIPVKQGNEQRQPVGYCLAGRHIIIIDVIIS